MNRPKTAFTPTNNRSCEAISAGRNQLTPNTFPEGHGRLPLPREARLKFTAHCCNYWWGRHNNRQGLNAITILPT
jgi:hypothetical protein